MLYFFIVGRFSDIDRSRKGSLNLTRTYNATGHIVTREVPSEDVTGHALENDVDRRTASACCLVCAIQSKE